MADNNDFFFTENLSNVYCGGCLCLVYIAVEL